MDNYPTLQTKALRKASDLDEYKLYRAALEWSLVDPIVIESREDLKSKDEWRDRIEPYRHQVTNLITFCRRLPVSLLADDVGLGKTISAGLVMSELMSRGRISKTIIVCPKLLLQQWQEELETKFGIPSVIAIGRELVSAKPPDDRGAVITTYHSARLYLDKVAESGFEMLILDEAHKLRNLYGVDPVPQIAKRFRQALADRLFKYVLMLTATPIQNRLWDIYSLVDLLTVARGHQNPFGSEGTFARRFIADNRAQARKLVPERQEEFRSIVYGYMSRIRRDDANLQFPKRIVQLHKVTPTTQELELIAAIAEPIQSLNPLTQILILQMLVSSPQALSKTLLGMADRGTVPVSFAKSVKVIVEKMPMAAKLQGLHKLIDQLRKEKPENWRVLIFTRYLETQTTIQLFLEEQGIQCGLINGGSGSRNQETIAKFKKRVPEIHVIVSTEAGSEGVNLQAANVLVNYDLPWNPMIVEQRIGRIQRLASEHASVCIFNIILDGTFEEYIVGRLMEKLQMASHAIGDIEALLEASGLNENEDEHSIGFEEKIRQLVVSSLAGQNMNVSTQLAEQSIAEAKNILETEEKNINSLLGGMDNIDNGPQCPRLPQPQRSMDIESFIKAVLANRKDVFSGDNLFSSLKPGTPAFDRLVQSLIISGKHLVHDKDKDIQEGADEVLRKWTNSFGATLKFFNVDKVWCCFDGKALIHVRATVAHDSYERLVEVECPSKDHRCIREDASSLQQLNSFIQDAKVTGVIVEHLANKALLDPGISEFCRFYSERLVYELKSAGSDDRKRKRLEDEFTPQVIGTLVGLEGEMHRTLEVQVTYNVDSEFDYESHLTVNPSRSEIGSKPEMEICEVTGKSVPRECLKKCEISGKKAMQHLLVSSDISGRLALPENTILCSLSNKRVLVDEVEKSDLTGQLVTKSLLKTSALSGKRAEPTFFTRCEFTSAEILESESAVSQCSGKRYRVDERIQSAVSGKTGHRQEFITCSITQKYLLPTEAEKCEVTSKIVMPGILERCQVSGMKVLPSEIEKSAVTGKKALKKFFVASSISGAFLLEDEGLRSVTGKYCVPAESELCTWSDRVCHPDDLRSCRLTGMPIYFKYMTKENSILAPLKALLDGMKRKSDRAEVWPAINSSLAAALENKHSKIETSELSPNKKCLALSVEVKTLLGLKTRYVGLLYSLQEQTIIGRVSKGKRDGIGWNEE